MKRNFMEFLQIKFNQFLKVLTNVITNLLRIGIVSILFMSATVCAPITYIDFSLVETVNYYYKDKSFYNSEFSPKLFLEAMEFVEIQNPEIVLRQSILETGWFKSRIFIELNNFFGMQFPISRETTSIGWVWADYYDGKRHKTCKYSHWYDSVKDYKLWQDYWLEEELKRECYYKFLHELPYAVSKNYVKILKQLNVEHIIT